jgi:hypothetical protein
VHLDEREPSRATGVAIGDYADASHVAISREDVPELLLGDVERTIAYVNLGHETTPDRKGLSEG